MPKLPTDFGLFAHLGLLTRTDEEGRVYPYTEEARQFTRRWKKGLGFSASELRRPARFSAVDKKEHFQIHTAKDCFEARKLLIACGGKSWTAVWNYRRWQQVGKTAGTSCHQTGAGADGH